MSWDWWWRQPTRLPDGAVVAQGSIRINTKTHDVSVYDSETGTTYQPVKREVTVARSTRAMPERKR